MPVVINSGGIESGGMAGSFHWTVGSLPSSHGNVHEPVVVFAMRRPAAWCKIVRTSAAGQPGSDHLHQFFANPRIKGFIYLADTGRTGDIDFGKEVPDHVESDK